MAFTFTKIDTQAFDEATEYDRQLLKKGLVLQDAALDSYLQTVGERVLGSRTVPEKVDFHFHVLRDPMVQAFALPNGSVYVTTGLLSLLENESQLAGVLGHETSHVFERHGYLSNRSVRKKILTMNVIQGVAAAAPGGAGAGVQIFGAALQVGAVLSSPIIVASIFGYSRQMERQADSDGLAAMVAASYDPRALSQAFELLDQDQRLEFEPIQSIYNDHPKLTERQAAASDFAASHRVATPRSSPEIDYLARVAPAICENIEADIDSRRERSALVRAQRLDTFFPNEPKYQILLADAYRSLGAKTPTPSEEELTRHGQAEHRKEHFNMTEQEEQKRLLQNPEGAAALHENLAQAEHIYRNVIAKDPSYADAHRGLGFLCEQQSRYTEAVTEYRLYLQLVAGTSMDRMRIERRLQNVEKLSASNLPST